MNPTLSVYLNILRFGAAFAVFVGHLCSNWMSMPLPVSIQDDAVIVFFVLSGFLIAFVVDTKDRTVVEYMSARLARLWSVALPALAICWGLAAIGRVLGLGHYVRVAAPPFVDELFVRFLGSAVFANEMHGLSIVPWFDVPYWSLSYEFSYYLLFGTLAFLSGFRRIVFFFLVCIVVGERVILLFPIWLMGVVLYRLRNEIAHRAGVALFCLSIIGYAAISYSKVGLNFGEQMVVYYFGVQDLGWSSNIVQKYLVALVVAANIAGACAISRRHDLRVVERPVALLASGTLTLYLMHWPLLEFLTGALPRFGWGAGDVVLPAVCTLAAIAVLTMLTERRKHVFRRAIDVVVARVAALQQKAVPEPVRR